MSEWNYTNLWRPNYEAAEATAWCASMAASTAVHLLSSMPLTPYLIT
ncbi:conjugal transfer pilus assembly protein TraD, partial [Azotobacter beijerinckii]